MPDISILGVLDRGGGWRSLVQHKGQAPQKGRTSANHWVGRGRGQAVMSSQDSFCFCEEAGTIVLVAGSCSKGNPWKPFLGERARANSDHISMSGIVSFRGFSQR